MIKLGIIGYPLSHSLSPAMHNVALQKEGIKGEYVILETPPESLKKQVEMLKASGYRGFNVTIPHKVAIMEFLDNIDDFAGKVGAVNTVVISQDGKLSGHNTDVYGFTQAIPEDIREGLKGKNAAVLGSGGAARAVIAGLAALGIKEVTIFARNEEKSQELIEVSIKNYPHLKINYTYLSEKADMQGAYIVVNTTPLGMQGKYEDESPLTDYSLDSLDKEALVYDIVYRPRQTKLLKMAEEKGLSTLDGLDMLILQGAKAFSLWTAKEPDIETMKQTLLQSLQ